VEAENQDAVFFQAFPDIALSGKLYGLVAAETAAGPGN